VTREIKFREGSVRLIVPGTWASVPLSDPDTAAAFVKKLVKKQVGTADRLARVRREATQEIMISARDAALAGAHSYFMSLELLPGVPFPAAILLTDAPWPPASREALASGDVAAALKAAAPEGEVATQRNGPVARVAEMTQGKVTEDGTEFLSMRLAYYIPFPDRSQILLAQVSVPNIPSAEPFATLFDEILDSAAFTEDPAGSEDRSTDGPVEPVAEVTGVLAQPARTQV
jgi:hypothetical protein